MAKYLVTGAAGFIGSTLARTLIEEGDEVWTIDNLSTGFKSNLPEGIHFIEGDCQETESIQELKGAKFNAIIHLAAQSSGEVSFEDPVYDLRTNTEATLKLIDYGLSTGCDRLIYASSMSVYGSVPDEAINENHSCLPTSFYGVGKLASEHYLHIYQTKGLKPTILRYFNVYGPNQNLSNLKQGMVSIYLAQLLNNDEIIVKGPKDRFRDFISVHDIVRATKMVIKNDKSIGGTYNVGSGVKTTVEQLLNKLIELSGIDKKIIFGGGTPGDQKGIYADSSLFENKFDFEATVTLEEGLKEMILWAKDQIKEKGISV